MTEYHWFTIVSAIFRSICESFTRTVSFTYSSAINESQQERTKLFDVQLRCGRDCVTARTAFNPITSRKLDKWTYSKGLPTNLVYRCSRQVVLGDEELSRNVNSYSSCNLSLCRKLRREHCKVLL